MRLPVSLPFLLALVNVLHPTAASADLVTFRLVGNVASPPPNVFVGDATAVAALQTRFPVGTPMEVTYTFESTTPDCPTCRAAELDARYYQNALVGVTIRIGTYTATAVTGDIIVVNNGLYANPVCGAYSADFYEVVSAGIQSAETVGPLALDNAFIDIFGDCSDAPTARFDTPTLFTSPPSLGLLSPFAGVWLEWLNGTTRAQLFATITSLTLVPSSPPPNTDTGSGVAVAAPVTLPNGTTSSVSLTFDDVEIAGETTVTAAATGPPPPTGFKLTNPPVYYDITTTATFIGNVRVCLGWTEGQIANEATVQLFHNENSRWVNITDPTSRDALNNRVCGTASSLSPFTLFDVKYAFTGFFQPVDNAPMVNSVKAGSAVPVKFSLGGNLGLNIFAAGYPRTQLTQCQTGVLIDAIEETSTAGSSSLSYDASTGRYTYIWKTDKAWAGSCRELQVKLNDGDVYAARFTMPK